jgi:peptidyl-prolyl cis-trans isomerase SurA
MKKNLLLILILFFYFNSTKILYSAIENKIVVRVQNKVITSFDVKNKILSSLILTNQEINQKNIDNMKSQTLNILISNKLKEIELEYRGIKDEINDSRLKNYLDSISSNDLDGLKKKFKYNNIDYELFVNEIKTDLKWQGFIYKVYSNKILIDENSIDEEVQNIMNSSSVLKEFNLSEIEILRNNNKKEKSLVEDLLKKISENGFEEIAFQYSISTSSTNKGKLGWINSKSLSKQIFNVVEKMSPGDVSTPIITANSILILKLNEVKSVKSDQVNVINLKKNLINKKKNEMFKLYSNSLLSKLRNNSLIRYK